MRVSCGGAALDRARRAVRDARRGRRRHRVRRGEPQGGDGRAGATLRGGERGQGRRLLRREQRAGEADRGGRAGRHLHFRRPRLDGLRRPAQPARAGHARQPAAQHARADRAGVEHVDAQDRARISASPRALGSDKLAMANPDSVPAGKYGKSALEKLGVWTSVEKQVARAENVRAALALVSRGEAPFGIVYSTDALADKGVRIVDTFPPDSYPPIVYPAAVLATSKSPAAQGRCSITCAPPPARAVWEKYGFGTGAIGACSDSSAGRSRHPRAEPAGRASSAWSAACRSRSSWRTASRAFDFPARRWSMRSSTCRWCCRRSSSASRCSCCSASAGPIGSVLDEWFGIVFAFRWTGAALASALMGFPLMVRAIRLSIEAIDQRLEVGGAHAGRLAALGVRVDHAAARAARHHHRHAAVVRARPGRIRRDDHVRVEHSRRDADAAAGDLHVHAGARRRRAGAAPEHHRRRAVDRRAGGLRMADAPLRRGCKRDDRR